MEIVGKKKVEKRWQKMPWEKPREWMEVMIADTYKPSSGADKMEHDHKYTDQFWPPIPNVKNDGYKLSNIIAKDNEGMVVVVVKFLNPIFTRD